MSLGFRVSIPGLTNLAPVDEILDHLLESGKVKIPSYPSEGRSDPHVSTLLSMSVEEYFGDHLVGDSDLDLFLPEHIGIGTDEDASGVQTELGEDTGVTSK